MSQPKKALLLIAHGSRRQESNQEVQQLASKIADSKQHSFDIVHTAFLEIAEPSITQGLEFCAKAGASNIVVFPYFLAAGRHVIDDIPHEVEAFKRRNTHITINIANYLGCLPDMPEIILQLAESE